MSSLFALPFIPALGPTGLPAGGATLTFYQTGTTTLVTIYADAALTTALPNPLTADAYGRFAQIYLRSSVIYRIVLKTALGTVIGDVDPYSPSVGLSANAFTGRQSAPGFDTVVTSGNAANQISGPAGSYRYDAAQTSGLNRWAWGADDAAESGSNAGSNYFLARYGDNGVEIDRPIKGSRKTGAIQIKDMPVPITYFGAVADSDCTTGNGTDNLPAWNAALASGARVIYFPAAPTGKGYRFSNTLNATRSVWIIGEGVVPFITTPGNRGGGSWIYCDHGNPGMKLYNYDVGYLTGGKVDGIGFIRNQPAFAPGWAPGPNDYDMQVLGGRWYVNDICFFNSTNAIANDYSGYGRLEIGRIYGDPYTAGLYVDRCAHLLSVGEIEWWPMSTFSPYAQAWKYANFRSAIFKRCDGAAIGRFFSINQKEILFTAGTDGPPKDIHFDWLYTDLHGYAGITADSSVQGGGSFSVSHWVNQGAISDDGLPGGAYVGVVIAAPNFTGLVGQLRATRFNQQVGLVSGTNSNLSIGQHILDEWNRASVGASAYAATGSGSRIDLLSAPIIRTSGGAVGDGSGRVKQAQYTAI